MRKRYPSDVTKEQFKRIEPMLLSARKKTRPREVDLYDIFLCYFVFIKEWLSVANDSQ